MRVPAKGRKGDWCHQELEEARKGLPWGRQREHDLPTLSSWTSRPQSVKEWTSVALRHPVVICHGSPGNQSLGPLMFNRNDRTWGKK